jgi:hypothetical protein
MKLLFGVLIFLASFSFKTTKTTTFTRSKTEPLRRTSTLDDAGTIEDLTKEKERLQKEVEECKEIKAKLDTCSADLKTKNDSFLKKKLQLERVYPIVNSFHENADIQSFISINSCAEYHKEWPSKADWDNLDAGKDIDVKLADECFEKIFQSIKLDAVKPVEEKLENFKTKYRAVEDKNKFLQIMLYVISGILIVVILGICGWVMWYKCKKSKKDGELKSKIIYSLENETNSSQSSLEVKVSSKHSENIIGSNETSYSSNEAKVRSSICICINPKFVNDSVHFIQPDQLVKSEDFVTDKFLSDAHALPTSILPHFQKNHLHNRSLSSMSTTYDYAPEHVTTQQAIPLSTSKSPANPISSFFFVLSYKLSHS